MTYVILIALISGIFAGTLIPEGLISNLSQVSSFALNLLILSVGIDLGCNKAIFIKLKNMGLKILLVPASIVLGSLTGGIITGLIFKMPLSLSMAISAGFGWYSLSGVLLSNIAGVEAGAIAFLTNVLRELIAVIAIPIIAGKLNYITSIGPAGATSMDSTLPIISKSTGEETAMIAFINGAVLSAMVPIIVPVLYGLKF
ncbi:hypothetical protein OXPF_06860 [Oxobacter pfennigii]|uniref:Lysine exporter LysO n=1 Tax=Oxobacter pfennigii TaxID=36849 RepID=A0A0P8X3S7_9CLOT|nr:lysine exporter LysO family protein [Oxobacter pfennigii]KPU45453.1 hypothetical protein OXPF_06860 [Oxobacter pfennigii]